MKYVLSIAIILVGILITLVAVLGPPAFSQVAPTIWTLPRGGIPAQNIASITQFSTFAANTQDASLGTVVVTMNPASPAFSGSLTLTNGSGCPNTSATNFQVVGTSTISTQGALAPGPYCFNIVATPTVTTIPPLTQAEAVTGIIPPVTIGPTTLTASSFNAIAGDKNLAIGTLSTASASGAAIPTYTMRTPTDGLLPACTTACADAALFAISGKSLNVGAADIVCSTSPCTYHITVRDTDAEPGATPNPFDQALTLTGTSGAITQQLGVVSQFTALNTFPAGVPSTPVGIVNVRMCPTAALITASGHPCYITDNVPPFAGSLSITGANSCGFVLSGNTVLTGPQAATNCTTTGGPHGNGLFDDWSVVATQSGTVNGSLTQTQAVSAEAITTGSPQWLVAHADGCFLVSGTTADMSCQLRWRDSYTANSMLIDLAWRAPSGSGTPPPINFVGFKNGAATCALVPNTFATDPTTSIAIATYLCPNLTVPASAFDIDFGTVVTVAATGTAGSRSFTVASTTNVAIGEAVAGPGFSGIVGGISGTTITLVAAPELPQATLSQNLTGTPVFFSGATLVLVRTTELYGCANPCVPEVGNAVVTPKATGVMSISTAGPTTSANEFIHSFTYNPCGTITSPSATVISNTTSGCSAFLTQYQIGATPATYTNSFSNTGSVNVLQNIAAFPRNAAPPTQPPAVVGQKTFTAFDNQGNGAPVSGGVYAYASDFSLVLPSNISLTVNPGGLLALNSARNGFVLGRALTAADDGSYTGQLRATQGGVTTNQAISLIVQPTRTYAAGTTNCPTTPPPAAQRAGLTYLAYCLDPAATFYQTLTNWMNCSDTSTPAGLQWYPGWPSLTCRDTTFIPDPNGSGRTVMDIHWHSTTDINYMRSVNSTASYVKVKTVSCELQGCTTPYGAPTVNSYWEARSATYPIVNDTVLVNFAPDLFMWNDCPVGVANCNDTIKSEYSLVELDFYEFNGPRITGGSSGFHWWNNVSYGYSAQNEGVAVESQFSSIIPGWSATQTHSYGTLLTNDATAGYRIASFVDDVPSPGTPNLIGRANPGSVMNPYDVGVLPTWDPLLVDDRTVFSQNSYWILWFGGTYGLTTTNCQTFPACVAAGGQPDTFIDYQYIANWTCGPQWATDPTCGGTVKALAQ